MIMKKLIYLLLFFLLTGCNKENNVLEYNNSYYKIASPYKAQVSSYSLKEYDKNSVIKMLTYVSKEYFKTNNSLYQEGQYLDSTDLKQLITSLNETDEITIDDITLKPNYITSIYEQDYLNMDNTLKGISLAVVLDNKQKVNNTYKQINEDIVIDCSLSKINEIIKYLRNKEELKNIKIVIAIYLNGIKYVGATTIDNIKLDYVNYNYQKMDSSYVMNNDIDNYNNYLAIKNALNDYNIYISSQGLYKDKNLINVEININKSYFKTSEILSMADIIKQKINYNYAKIYFKENNLTKAFINKSDTIEIHILEEI